MQSVNESKFTSKNMKVAGLAAQAGLTAAGLGYYAYKSSKPHTISHTNKKPVIRSYDGLDRETARVRRTIVQGDVHYNLYMIFQEKSPVYHGRVEVVFKVNSQKDVLIDYCGEIRSMTVNGKNMSPTYYETRANYDGHLLKVQGKDLKLEAENKVLIDFESTFSTELDGLTKMEYPIEGSDEVETYIYGWNEKYAQQRTFPHFNQPNIRGTLKLFIAHPTKWAAFSNEGQQKYHQFAFQQEAENEFLQNVCRDYHSLAESCQGSENCLVKVEQAKSQMEKVLPIEASLDFQVKEFVTTRSQPSYTYCFNVGPWKFIKPANELSKQVGQPNRKISEGDKTLLSCDVEKKMRLFCTSQQFESLQKVSADWYAINKFGLEFFIQYLDSAYPYSKYDITIVPKNTAHYTAMEYAGNMQFSEHLVEDNNIRKSSYLAFITFKQIAHQWVGNLVSVEWHDNAFIKACTAEYLAQICYEAWFKEVGAEKQGKYVNPKIYFARRKTEGLFADLSDNTKSGLRTNIEFAKEQPKNFTNILYGKGMAVYEELFRICDGNGREFFRDFVRQLINDNQNKSVNQSTMEDCLLKTARSRDLHYEKGDLLEIFRRHITDAGVDRLTFELDSKNQKIVIHNDKNRAGGYKAHYGDVAIYGSDGKVKTTLAFTLVGEKTEIQLKDMEDEDLDATQILPNYSNYGYFYYELDDDQREYFKYWIKVLDKKALAVLNQYEFLRTVYGDNTVKDYLDVACRIIKNHPKLIYVICGKVYIQGLMQLSTPEVQSYIKDRVTRNLFKVLPKIKDHISCAEFILIYADSDEHIRKMYELQLAPENHDIIRKVLSQTTQKRWCIKLLGSSAITEDQQIEILEQLKPVDFRHYKAYVERKRVEDMSVDDLKKFWKKTCSQPVSEQDAKQTAMARKEFIKQSDKFIIGGFSEEFFKKLPKYLVTRDSYEVNLFMKMCPSAETSEEIQAQIDKFNEMLLKYTLVQEEQDLLREKINKLSIELRISKNNTTKKLAIFRSQATIS